MVSFREISTLCLNILTFLTMMLSANRERLVSLLLAALYQAQTIKAFYFDNLFSTAFENFHVDGHLAAVYASAFVTVIKLPDLRKQSTIAGQTS